MKKKSLWRATMMARMAKDGDVEGLAEIITEMMEEPAQLAEAAAVPADPPALPADPVVAAVVSAVEENLAPQEAPVVVETPVDQPVIVDCGPRILEALERIIALLSGTADCNPVQPDCGASCDPELAAKDENPDAVVEAVAETAAEELVGQVAAAAVEAVAEAAAPEISENLEPEDPVEALVAEILESGEGEEAPNEEILSGILEPEGDAEEETPEDNAQAADALRATLATFRPMLQKMSPQDRRRFNADVAARMKKLTRKAPAGKPSAYAALRKSADHDTAARDLGRRIMESRNANLRK